MKEFAPLLLLPAAFGGCGMGVWSSVWFAAGEPMISGLILGAALSLVFLCGAIFGRASK